MAEQAHAHRHVHGGLNTGYIISTFAVAVIVVADQIAKWLVRTRFLEGQSKEVIVGLFNLCHTRNSGVVFGLFQGIPWLFAALTVVAIVVLTMLVRSLGESAPRLHYATYGLIIGGATGNLIDRLRLGAVTDFLDFHIGRYHWPAFNVADSAVCVGVVLLLLTTVFATGKDQSDVTS